MDKRKSSILLTLILILSLTIEVKAQQIPGKIILKYYLNIKNQGEVEYSLEDMKRMMLLAWDDYQKLQNLKVSVNGKPITIINSTVNEDKNIVVQLMGIPNSLPPKTQINIEIEMEINLSSRQPPEININESGKLNEIPENLREKYCQLTGLWNMSRNAQIIAKNIAQNKTDVMEILVSLIRWIENNIEIPTSGGARIPQYPDETINSKTGDCDDQSNLLVAMCRSLGIPAYIQMAFIYIGDRRFEDTMFNGRYKLTAENAGGHAWARVYIPPWGWINVDMTYYIPYEIRGKNIISINPLDHIRNGALYISTTIITENFISGDYINDLKNWINDLEKYDLMWEEKYSINIQTTSPYQTDSVILGVAALLIGLTATLIIAYIKISKRKNN